MPERVNGGVFSDQVLTGSLKHFRIVGANFQGAIGPTGQPVSGSAAEIIFNRIAAKATVVIMDPVADSKGMSFALETNRADWTADELQIMINSLGTIGVDQIDVSNVTVEQVPYDLIEDQSGGGGATTFIELTDTPSSYSTHNNKYVTVNSAATGLVFTTLPAIPTNNNFSFIGLSDTDNTVVNNGYLRWNSTGTSVGYSATIPSTAVTGFATVATTGSYNDLTNTPTIPTNANFSLTGLSDTADITVGNGYLRWNSAGTQVTYSTTIPAASITGLATVATTGSYTDLINQPDLSGYAETADLATVATTGSYNDLLDQPDFVEAADLATVATTGDYNDLINQPDLSIYAEDADLATVALTGDYNDLLNAPVIPTNGDFSFAGLSDTPANYTDAAGKYVVVNSTANGLEFIAGQPPAVNNQVFFHHNGNITQTISTAFSTMLFETPIESSSDVNYTVGAVTIQSSGTYTISYQVSTNASTAARTSTECKLQVDGNDVPGSFAYIYNRNTTDGRSSVAATMRVLLTAGQVVTVQGRGTITPVVTLPDACRLLITKDI